jgi:D-alanyl-D-alanine carboxypeptidase
MRNHIFVALAVLASIALFTQPAIAQSVEPASLHSRITGIVTQVVEKSQAGAIVLVEVDGEQAIATTGLANRATGLEMDSAHMMRPASIGKLYTAAVIHRLVLDGQLDFEAPAATYLQAETIAGIANADIASVGQLISHLSGIPDYYDDAWFEQVNTVEGNTLDRTLAHIRGRPPEFEPGTEHSYSNTNFQLLGRIAENITGKSLGQLMQEIIFAPLDLQATVYNQPFGPADVIHGYGLGDDPDFDAYHLLENDGPDGGVFTTAADMAAFYAALFTEDGALADLGQSMLSQKYDRGNGQYRALGPFFVDHRLGVEIVGHGGSIVGYASFAVRVLDPGITVIVHLNQDRSDLAGAITRQILMDLVGPEE